MKQEQIVTDVDLSLELKEKGVKQESVFYWRKYSLNPDPLLLNIPSQDAKLAVLSGELEYECSAFTAAELSESYPSKVWLKVKETSFHAKEAEFYFVKHEGIYKVSLMIPSPDKEEVYEYHREEDKNEANARAKMLIYLMDNKIGDKEI